MHVCIIIADKWRVILRAQTIETTYINASFVNVSKIFMTLIITGDLS